MHIFNEWFTYTGPTEVEPGLLNAYDILAQFINSMKA